LSLLPILITSAARLGFKTALRFLLFLTSALLGFTTALLLLASDSQHARTLGSDAARHLLHRCVEAEAPDVIAIFSL
jgi:hypothetical protein